MRGKAQKSHSEMVTEHTGGARGASAKAAATATADEVQSHLALKTGVDPLLDPDIDPKKAKRIIANRAAAARSKKRKTHEIQELETRVTELQSELKATVTKCAEAESQLRQVTEERKQLESQLRVLEAQAAAAGQRR